MGMNQAVSVGLFDCDAGDAHNRALGKASASWLITRYLQWMAFFIETGLHHEFIKTIATARARSRFEQWSLAGVFPFDRSSVCRSLCCAVNKFPI